MQAEAANWKARGLQRDLVCVEEVNGDRIRVGDTWLWNLASNDYLGLARDIRVREAAAEAARNWGGGAGASPLVSGWTRLHQDLADALAEFEQVPAVALFPSGFAANLGTIVSLVGPGDAVFLDRLDHACLVAGAKLSGARVRVYPHADLDQLESTLQRERNTYRRALIVTDGVFSMDGDIAPLAELVELADRFAAMTLVDEAHATGVVGPGGRGSCALLGVEDRVTVRVGTLSKALGAMGGFVAGSRTVVDRVLNRAPSYMFSTSLAPAAVGAARAALKIVRTEPGLLADLEKLSSGFRQALGSSVPDSAQHHTPIIPVVLGPADEAVRLSLLLRQAGFWVPAIRPPTVPRGTSRLRVSLSATLPAFISRELAVTLNACVSQS